jgi:hypothetical protein
MSYKNTVKLFVSNFDLVWKQLLYLLICAGIFALFFFTTLNPIASLLSNNGVFAEFKELIETVYSSPRELALMLSNCFKHLLNVLVSNFLSIWLQLIGLLILGILLPSILIQMSFYNLCAILHKKLTMNMNVSYIQSAIQNLGKSIKYAFANILFTLPFFALTILFVDIYLTTATSVVASIVGLIVLVAVMIIIHSIKISIFTYYVGYMVENNSSPFVAFGKGVVNVLKNFWKVISMSIIITLTIIFVNAFIMVFTFFSGLIIVIPATFVFLAIYYLVVYFNIKGERYYLAPNLIFNPVKRIIKQEDYIKTTIPEETREIQVTTTVIKKKKNKSKKTNIKKSNN